MDAHSKPDAVAEAHRRVLARAQELDAAALTAAQRADTLATLKVERALILDSIVPPLALLEAWFLLEDPRSNFSSPTSPNHEKGEQ